MSEAERERCPACDRQMVDPAARADDPSDEEAAPFCFAAIGNRSSQVDCHRHAVNWRARALAAEALLAEHMEYAARVAPELRERTRAHLAARKEPTR